MNNPTYPLPHGYHLEEVDYKEWMPYAVENMGIPFSDTVSFDIMSYQSPEDKQKRDDFLLGDNRFTLFYLVRKGEEIVGWHSSRQSDWNTLYMELTGIYPDHQGKGLYTAILKIVMKRAEEIGFGILTSKHHVVNNAVLVPKLKAGFVIHSFEIHQNYGLMVHLRYYTREHDRQLHAFRAGHQQLPASLKPYIALWEDDEKPENV